jgi:hypothetical protein
MEVVNENIFKNSQISGFSRMMSCFEVHVIFYVNKNNIFAYKGESYIHLIKTIYILCMYHSAYSSDNLRKKKIAFQIGI